MTFAAKEISKSATRALGTIIAKFKSLGGISFETFQRLFETNVQPILLYGAGVWGTKEYKIINTVQNKAQRFILGVPKTAHNVATRGDTGWMSMKSKQLLEVTRLWPRLHGMDQDRLTSKIFHFSWNQAKHFRTKNWEFGVMALFSARNLDFLTTMNNINSYTLTFQNCKQIIQRQDEDEWTDQLWNDKNKENGNKLRSYRIFKQTLETEKYVKLNMPWYKKCYYVRLRVGSLPLEIEKGRYKTPKIPVDERTCKCAR